VAPTAILAVALLIGAIVIGGGRSVSAQDAAGHPAHIHSGTCATLGDVVHPLDNVGGGTMMGTPAATDSVGSADAIPTESSVTVVQADLATLTGSEFAINVHESAENIGNYIACGDVGGQIIGDNLVIGLGELNDSGYFGTAWLHDNGDGTTVVFVALLEEAGEDGAEEGTPEAAASDDAAAATGEEVAVDIVDFSYSPDPLDVAVGTTVTWTNQDSAAHTATSDDGGATFQSDSMDQGVSFSFTFDEAGTFAYHCEFHPNMTGTINVQ
jgi:plastocyanin